MKTLLFAVLLTLPIFGQVTSSSAFPDQVISAGIAYNQQSSPNVAGFVAYGKLINRNQGVYEYTKINETSIQIKPKLAVQTQTETGLCAYIHSIGVFDVFGCATGGLATAADNAGISGSGNLLVTKSLPKGWFVGMTGGPSYSGVTNTVAYNISLVFGWGK